MKNTLPPSPPPWRVEISADVILRNKYKKGGNVKETRKKGE
jgi:hypothetical protein